ncbi:MAG: hypothetical protein EHM21_12275 [Chloroflexi bacterium]|nr:MAG: hypothetical protein EHM21_12275 [Chloroflexota bacterium]
MIWLFTCFKELIESNHPASAPTSLAKTPGYNDQAWSNQASKQAIQHLSEPGFTGPGFIRSLPAKLPKGHTALGNQSQGYNDQARLSRADYPHLSRSLVSPGFPAL